MRFVYFEFLNTDIVEVKSVKVPTAPVRLTMEAVCIMLGVKPARARDPENPSKVIFDYWDPSKKILLSDPRFLQNLINFDKESIPQKGKSRKYNFCYSILSILSILSTLYNYTSSPFLMLSVLFSRQFSHSLKLYLL